MFLVWLLQENFQVSQEHGVFHQFTDGRRFGGFSEYDDIYIINVNCKFYLIIT